MSFLRDVGDVFTTGRYGSTTASEKTQAENRKRAVMEDDEKEYQERLQGLKSSGDQYFAGESGRNIERDDVRKEYESSAGRNLDQNTQSVGLAEQSFRSQQSELQNEAERQSEDATKVYNTLTPRYEDVMNEAQAEAAGAMTLQQSMDPNNKVAAGTRDLYGQQGTNLRNTYNTEADQAQGQYNSLGQMASDQYTNLGNQAQQGYDSLGNQAEQNFTSLAAGTQQNFDQYGQQSQDRYNTEAGAARARYEDAAQGENRLGLSNFGALSALGAQAAQGAQGPGPMTLGQQMAGLAASNRQAGEAFSNTQRRMQGLKDQGMMSESELRRAGLSSRDQYAGEGLRTSTSQRQAGLASKLGLKEKGQDSRNQYSERGVQSNLGLREKGVDSRQSLRNQGIAGQDAYNAAGLERGFERSDSAYAKGLDAKDRYRNSMADRENLMDRNVSRQSALRGERGGYSSNIRGSSLNQEGVRFGNQANKDDLRQGVGMAGINDRSGLATNQFDFGRGITGMQMGRQDIATERALGSLDRQQGIRDARTASANQALGGLLTMSGTGAGAFMGAMTGGPKGAMQGAQMGQEMVAPMTGAIQGQPAQPYQGQQVNFTGNQQPQQPQQPYPQQLGAQNYGMPMQQPMPQGSAGYGRYNLGLNPSAYNFGG